MDLLVECIAWSVFFVVCGIVVLGVVWLIDGMLFDWRWERDRPARMAEYAARAAERDAEERRRLRYGVDRLAQSSRRAHAVVPRG